MEVRTERMRREKTNCQVSVGDLQIKRSFSCVYKKHFSPISSKSLSNCREINQKSLVAYTEELNSHLRHTYRDKCGELAPIWSLENISLCVNCPFLSNYRSKKKPRILWKCTACRSLARTICVKWKKRETDQKCCNRRLFYIFVPLKTTKQTQYYDHTPQSV